MSGKGQIAPSPQSTPSVPKSRPSSFLESLPQSKGQFAVALDASGSMAPLIATARESIAEIIRRVSEGAGAPVKLRLYVYRDYDCLGYPEHPVLEHSELTSDVALLRRWLAGREAAGGGGNDGEAIEAALTDILARQEADAVLVAGDEPSNAKAHLSGFSGTGVQATAIELAPTFKQRRCPIHMFALGQRPSTLRDFKSVAAAAGGQFGRLDGGPDMIDLAAIAMLSRLRGEQGVRKYADQHNLTDNAKTFASALLPKPSDKK